MFLNFTNFFSTIILLSILLTLSVILCEVPPPYPSRGFRPSQPFIIPIRNQPQRQYTSTNPISPQTQYGLPNTENRSPVKVSARPSQFLDNLAQRQQHVSSTQKYGNPIEIDVRNNLRIVNSKLQDTYGTPSKQELPRVQYGLPYNRYRIQNLSENNFQNTITPTNNQPQVAYGPPDRLTPLQNQYGSPDYKNIEAFEKTRQFQTQIQKINELNNSPTVQYLPSKEATVFRNPHVNEHSEQLLPLKQPINFRSEAFQPSQQYLPIKAAADFRNAYEQSQYSSSSQKSDADRTNAISNVDNSRNVNMQYIPPNDSIRNTFNSQNTGSNFGVSEPEYIPSQHDNPSKVMLLNNFDVTPYQVPNQNSGSENQAQYDNSRPTNFAGNQLDPEYQNNVYKTSNRPSDQKRGSDPNTGDISNRNIGSSGRQSQYPQQRPAIGNVDITQVKVMAWSADANDNNSKPQPSSIIPTRTGDLRGLAGDTVTERYLPPTTTARSAIPRPKRPSVAPVPTSRPIEDTEETTETNGQSDNPNVAIATAVAGGPGEQQFYLLQPDGRLQRVLYQKTREDGDREYEYTANYHFQNIRADPNLVYTPLISLG